MIKVLTNQSLYNSFLSVFKKKTMFSVLFFIVLTTGFLVTYKLLATQHDIRQRATGTTTEFGFNTHVSAANNNLDINKFKSNVDILVSNNQKWIRINIIDFEVASPGLSPNTIAWNMTNLAVYDDAINYALSRGLHVFLATNTPSFAKDYSLADYKLVTNQYYSFLSLRYTGKIAVWQIFNEADVHNYRDYSVISSWTQTYLSDLNSVINVARAAVKSNDPITLITTNSGGYPMNDALIDRWQQYFDVLKDNLDVISVDMYPAPDVTEINKLASRIDTLHQRYGKDITVSETGLCTLPGVYTEADQQNYVTQIINSLKTSSVKTILLYEIMDENTTSNTCEGTFGIIRTDGSKKSSFDAIMAAMQSPTPTPTVTANPYFENEYLRIWDSRVFPGIIDLFYRDLSGNWQQYNNIVPIAMVNNVWANAELDQATIQRQVISQTPSQTVVKYQFSPLSNGAHFYLEMTLNQGLHDVSFKVKLNPDSSVIQALALGNYYGYAQLVRYLKINNTLYDATTYPKPNPDGNFIPGTFTRYEFPADNKVEFWGVGGITQYQFVDTPLGRQDEMVSELRFTPWLPSQPPPGVNWFETIHMTRNPFSDGSVWNFGYALPLTPTPTPTPTPNPPTATPTPVPPTATPTPATLVGDINLDGKVNVQDLSYLLSHWGTTDTLADLNHSGKVDVFDLSIMLSHWKP